jgi:outer membrane protein W
MRISLKRSLVFGLMFALGLCATVASAKTLDAGTLYIEPKVGLYANSNTRISSMFSYGGEVGYFVADGFSLGFEALGYVVTQKRTRFGGNGNYETVNAFSPIVMARYHFVNEERFNAFVGIGLGGFFSGVPVPRNGYSSNLTEVGEVGFNVALTNNVSMQLAGRYQHIGDFDNKGADNWGGNLAFKYAF